MKNMNPKMVRLLHEGFSISTLENLTEGQLNLLYKKTIQEQKGSVKLKNNPTPDQVKQYTDQGVNVEIGENEVTEKAKSKQQQKIMGLALSVKRGDTPKSKVSKSVKDMANKMSEKDLEDFASTKHKGLPKKVNAKKESDPKESVKKIEEQIKILNLKKYRLLKESQNSLVDSVKCESGNTEKGFGSKCVVNYKNGDKYEGTLLNGVPSEKGKYTIKVETDKNKEYGADYYEGDFTGSESHQKLHFKGLDLITGSIITTEDLISYYNSKNNPKDTETVKKLEESILKLIEDYLPPHTTKGELLKTIKSIKR